MSRTCALALFLAAYSCDAADTDQYALGPVAPTPAPTLLGPQPTPRANKVPSTTSTTPPPYGHGVSQTPWWTNKVVKKGLIGGAAAAGLATFGGLGIAAIVQANQKTTTPYVPPPTFPPSTTAPPTTVSYDIFNRAQDAQIMARQEPDESSMSPVLAGILILFGLLCCCGTIAFCAYMVSNRGKKRNTNARKTPPPQEDEEAPFLPDDKQQQFPMPPAYEPASMYAPAPSYHMPAPSYQLAPTMASAMVAPQVYAMPATTMYEYAAPTMASTRVAPVTTLAPSTTMAFAAPSYAAPSYAAPSYAAPAYAAPAPSMMMAPTTMAPSTQFPVTTYQTR